MIRALLFDLDGTIAETDPLHLVAFNAVLGEAGRSISWDDYATRVLGRSNEAIFTDLFPEADAPERARLADRKEALFREALGSIAPRAGLPALLDRAEAQGLALAVVTNAPRANAEATLAACGIADRFPLVIVADDLPRAKPDPLPYATAMERLGAAPGACIAFEDSVSGVRSASGAGARVFAVQGGPPDDALRAAGAGDLIRDFTAASLAAALP